MTLSQITESEVKVSWASAKDLAPFNSTVHYTLYHTTKAEQLGNPEKAKLNGQIAANITDTVFKVKGLTDGTTYYFNVVAEDESGNAVTYTEGKATTLDATPPVPGAGGYMYVSASYVSGEPLISLDWVQATDNVTAQATLEYKLIGIYDESLVSGSQTDQEVCQTVYDKDALSRKWETAISTSVFGTLAEAVKFAVVLVAVKDQAGNVAVYCGGYSDQPLGNLTNQSSTAPGKAKGPTGLMDPLFRTRLGVGLFPE